VTFEVVTTIVDVARHLSKAWKFTFAGLLMTMLDIALATHHITPVTDAVDGITRNFNLIESYGRDDCEFYQGGAVDLDAQGCELQLATLFRTQEQVHDAAVAFCRNIWFVGAWHANQCGNMTVIDGATQYPQAAMTPGPQTRITPIPAQ
jgi:hypothetical protein